MAGPGREVRGAAGKVGGGDTAIFATVK
jgi:hypothetical protein